MKFCWQEYYNKSIESGCSDKDFLPEKCYNAGILIAKINALGYTAPKYFSSCLRTEKIQADIYRQKGITDRSKIPFNSVHLTGEGVDIIDNGNLQNWLKRNIEKLEALGLYVEDFEYTPTWVHIQTRPTKKRFFRP